jgi:hypothetical protein
MQLRPSVDDHVFEVVVMPEGLEFINVARRWCEAREAATNDVCFDAQTGKVASTTSPDRMREHYSTVHPVEQRESIGAVLRLVKGGAVTGEPLASGTHGGTQRPVSGSFGGQSG